MKTLSSALSQPGLCARQHGEPQRQFETINGKSVVVNCGPASATLRYKGKTYRFKSGTCLRQGGSATLQLGIALIDDAKGNGSFAHMSITMLSNKLPAQIQADDGKLSVGGSAMFSGMATKQCACRRIGRRRRRQLP